MRRLDGITDLMDMILSKLWEIAEIRSLACCSPWGCKDMTEQLNNSATHILSTPVKAESHANISLARQILNKSHSVGDMITL